MQMKIVRCGGHAYSTRL